MVKVEPGVKALISFQQVPGAGVDRHDHGTKRNLYVRKYRVHFYISGQSIAKWSNATFSTNLSNNLSKESVCKGKQPLREQILDQTMDTETHVRRGTSGCNNQPISLPWTTPVTASAQETSRQHTTTILGFSAARSCLLSVLPL